MRQLARKILGTTTITRRLPREFGARALVVQPSVALSFLKPSLASHDEELFDAIRRCVRPGSVAWDIGANMGLFTFSAAYAAGPKGRVIAVEADPRMTSLLHRTNLKPHPESAPVDILCAAVSDSCGVARLSLAESAAQNSLAESGVPVPTITLDAMLDHFPAPDVIKCDIEGAEMLMLEGAATVLSEVRPAIYIEVKPRHYESAGALFTSYGYAIFHAGAEHLGPRSSCGYESLCVPAEKLTAYGFEACQSSALVDQKV